MSEKCFCHLNGYKVKDADARAQLYAHDVAIKGLSEGMNELDVAITESSTRISSLENEKVHRVLQPSRVYATNNHGQASAIQYTQAPSPNSIAQRGLNGELTAADPIQAEDVANKRYVDSKLGGGTGGERLYQHIINLYDEEEGVTAYISLLTKKSTAYGGLRELCTYLLADNDDGNNGEYPIQGYLMDDNDVFLGISFRLYANGEASVALVVINNGSESEYSFSDTKYIAVKEI